MNKIENLLFLNWLTATGTLALEICLFIFFLFLIYFKYTNTENKNNIKDMTLRLVEIQSKILKIFGINFKKEFQTLENFIILKIFSISLVSSVLTLIYSEIFGIIPCALCWFERVFMYGIFFISSISLFARNPLEQRGILRYLNIFSILGVMVALYHHILQITATSSSHLPCPVSGGECSKIIIFEYGHITFPFMALVMFLGFILMIYFVNLINKK